MIYLIIITNGCATRLDTFEPYNFQEELKSQVLEQKLDQVGIILDASISMTQPYMGQEKFQTAILTIHHINAALTSIRTPIGFYVLGTGSCHFCEKTWQRIHVSPYRKSRMDINELKKINPGGETPLKKGLTAVRKDFQSCTGKMGLIVVSDFETKDTINAFHQLTREYGNKLSICCITVGSPEKTIELMRQLSTFQNTIQCLSADQILEYNKLKGFVKSFFLRPIFDQDHDGVLDKNDHCDNTLPGAWVDQNGCPTDSDSDGILDGLDHCLHTLQGAHVDNEGCWQLPVLFYERNQFYMTRNQEKSLASFIKIIEDNRLCIEIQGHADPSGSTKNNHDVSYKRAQSVMAYLLSLGLRHYQMKIKALGASHPIDHRQARGKNMTQRRVTFKVIECQKQN